jgi:hypothetical protein
MSPQTTPPAPYPDISSTSPDAGSAQALFKEARRRRRRRWLAATAVVLVLSAAAAVSAVTRTHRAGPGGGRAGPAGAAPAAQSAAVAAWWDDVGLRVGDIYPGGRVTQRFVAEVNADPLPLVPAGERVYWVDPAGTFVPALGHWSEVVKYLDLATGQIGTAGPGQTVFLSADGRYLFMSQTATSLTETPVTGGAARSLTLPRGWYLPGGDGLADLVSGAGLGTANGIVVESEESPGPGGAVLAVWDPGRGEVTVVGRARAVIDSYTPAGERYSLLAWLPADCGPSGRCPVKITNTATQSVRTVRSPRLDGFAMGGSFSRDGSQLALFLNADAEQAAQLALVDLATGTVQVATEPRLALGIDIAWARWLPDGAHLIVGAAAGASYLVSSATLSAEPLAAAPGRDHHRGDSLDINYTTAVIAERS